MFLGYFLLDIIHYFIVKNKNKEKYILKFKTHLLKEKTKSHAIIIPIINEGERIRDQIKTMYDKGIMDEFDVIIVDGGSTDNGFDLEYYKNHSIKTALVRLSPGKQSTQLRMGLRYVLDSGYDYVYLLDGNNKDDITTLFRMKQNLLEGYDCVFPSRYAKGSQALNTPLMRKLAIRYVHVPMMYLKTGFYSTDTTNLLSGIPADLYKKAQHEWDNPLFCNYHMNHYIRIMIPKHTKKISELSHARSYPVGEIPTKVSPIKGNLHILLLLIALSLDLYDNRQ